MNKKGWLKIVEAFVAIILIASVLLILFNKGYFGGEDISDKVYESQSSILKRVELDDELRTEVLEIVEENVPLHINYFPLNVQSAIKDNVPNYLECEAMICQLDVACGLDPYPSASEEKDIYAKSIAITATLEEYNPRQLKLFCWVR